MAFAARHVTPRSTGILGWTLSSPGDADRIRLSRIDREDFFHADIVLPVVTKIVNILEALFRPELKIRKLDFLGAVGEVNAALVGDTVFLAANEELVEVTVGPAHDQLHDFMQKTDRAVSRNQNAPPHRRFNSLQHDFELIDLGMSHTQRLSNLQGSDRSLISVLHRLQRQVLINFQALLARVAGNQLQLGVGEALDRQVGQHLMAEQMRMDRLRQTRPNAIGLNDLLNAARGEESAARALE